MGLLATIQKLYEMVTMFKILFEPRLFIIKTILDFSKTENLFINIHNLVAENIVNLSKKIAYNSTKGESRSISWRLQNEKNAFQCNSCRGTASCNS